MTASRSYRRPPSGCGADLVGLAVLGASYRTLLDGTVWPTAARVVDLEVTLRYGEPTREDLLVAASVLSTYLHLATHPAPTASIVRQLRLLRRAEREAVRS